MVKISERKANEKEARRRRITQEKKGKKKNLLMKTFLGWIQMPIMKRMLIRRINIQQVSELRSLFHCQKINRRQKIYHSQKINHPQKKNHCSQKIDHHQKMYHHQKMGLLQFLRRKVNRNEKIEDENKRKIHGENVRV